VFPSSSSSSAPCSPHARPIPEDQVPSTSNHQPTKHHLVRPTKPSVLQLHLLVLDSVHHHHHSQRQDHQHTLQHQLENQLQERPNQFKERPNQFKERPNQFKESLLSLIQEGPSNNLPKSGCQLPQFPRRKLPRPRSLSSQICVAVIRKLTKPQQDTCANASLAFSRWELVQSASMLTSVRQAP